jgi:Mrp family chromosome partitioning ATPase
MVGSVRKKGSGMERTDGGAGAAQTDQQAAVGFFESAWRHRIALVIVVAMAAIVGYLVSSMQRPTFEASTTLLFSDGTGSPVEETALPGLDHDRYLATQTDRMTSLPVATAAAGILGDGTSADTVAASLTAVRGETSDTITITASASAPERAARLADAGAEGYLAVMAEQARKRAAAAAASLQRQNDSLQGQINRLATVPSSGNAAEVTALQDRLKEVVGEQSRLRVAAQEYVVPIQIVSPAAAPTSPARPMPGRDAGLAAIIALMAVSTVSWAFDARSQKRSDSGRITRLLGAQCLGRIPAEKMMPTVDPSTGQPVYSTQWQQMVSAVDASLREATGHCVLVTSPTSSEQASQAAVNFAVSAAADGRSVLLVDADHTTRYLSGLAGADTVPGLTELVKDGRLNNDDGSTDGGDRGEKNGSHVSLLAIGRPIHNSAAFYRTDAFRNVLATLVRGADLSLVVAPPVLEHADAGVLADNVDGILLVVPESVSDDQLRDMRLLLSWSRAGLIGYLLVERVPRATRWSRSRPTAANGSRPTTEKGSPKPSLTAFVKPLRSLPADTPSVIGKPPASLATYRGRAAVEPASRSQRNGRA